MERSDGGLVDVILKPAMDQNIEAGHLHYLADNFKVRNGSKADIRLLTFGIGGKRTQPTVA